ncbi:MULTISPECIES: FAD-binding dehydrogenase [unclassified Saccharopolyspora]|uniref:FAD-binding dehydrogenase n=1 Tax=unclassified Saccharopolyspora TaxID=2646250 RepID=UPI001CD2F0B0|nr:MULTISPECIES: FAD-binding dehydrogenase [unclassified Saccharopolyspora]MCA1189896.1 FAD-binding dehydrogenase [Saccharopolyspora sp. 6T]MCA1191186.1 FAD-binding dehydrogenase [Saccharopolyspora sp. 6V]MCA1229284.1 FAD-binding dehydrogenase [Saccharopolyspora sp. 6M]MCA1282877.1 FAD-binding dehydrogenase [Saccharopolyspora sp. 7B]
MAFDADVIVVGAGLAGLVATAELADAGRRVLLLDQEPEASLGGQAHWSFGGLFLVDSPEQRRLGVHDSRELAWQDWQGTAGFDRADDHWPRRWAEAYVDFAAGEKRSWLRQQGLSLFPLVQWAERGGSLATGHGNSVPRFHITWGTGPGVLEPFLRRVRAAEERGRVELRFRHRVTGLTTTGGAVDGVRGEVLEASGVSRGQRSSRTAIGEFDLRAQAVVVTSGGIGANLDLVRRNWPARLGPAPEKMIAGVPDHVDGRMLEVVGDTGGRIINSDRMWHYTEGIRNYDPVWTDHGIRILPGPSSFWIDALGRRLPPPLFPGADTLATLAHIGSTGHDHTWFVLNRRIISREFALSGSEQNPDLTGRNVAEVLARGGEVTPGPVAEFVKRGADFVTRRTLPELVRGMNELTGADLIDAERLERDIVARDRQVTSGLGKDAQISLIRAARHYSVDRLVRVAPPHRLLDPAAGPLVAVRLTLLTRKTLGGVETDLDARVIGAGGSPLPGLYAAGEVAGFGGGGMHGYRSLEGTFLGGCLFSGRTAGRAAARATA